MYRHVKRALDFAVSLCLLALLSPILLWILWKIRRGSPGGAIFRQIRIGQNQKEFTFYKFRTMVENAEQLLPKVRQLNETDGPVFKVTDDPRLTKFGKWLRDRNLDELPQLWNVLNGNMSLVGFRPPLPGEVKSYEKWQMRRFDGKPGITSLWAIGGAHKLSFNEWIKKDLWYYEHSSLPLDLKIIWATAADTLRRLL